MKILLCLLLTFIAGHAEAARVHMIADMAISEHGLCLGLSKRRGGAEEITQERIRAVIKRLRLMKLDGPRLLDPLRFNLVTSGRSNQFGGSRLTLAMVQADQFGNLYAHPVSTGTVAHEIGHWIGHSLDIRGRPAYESFRTSAFRNCRGFVGYSTHLRSGNPHGNDLNETFAEVFSGYITAPNFLKQACPAGYEFMRDQVFRGELSRCPDPAKQKIPLPQPRPSGAPARSAEPAVSAPVAPPKPAPSAVVAKPAEVKPAAPSMVPKPSTSTVEVKPAPKPLESKPTAQVVVPKPAAPAVAAKPAQKPAALPVAPAATPTR